MLVLDCMLWPADGQLVPGHCLLILCRVLFRLLLLTSPLRSCHPCLPDMALGVHWDVCGMQRADSKSSGASSRCVLRRAVLRWGLV